MKEFHPYRYSGERAAKLVLEIQKTLSPYLELFMGEKVLLSDIKEKAPHCLPALKILMDDGRVVGQTVLGEEDDMLLFMPAVVNRLEEK